MAGGGGAVGGCDIEMNLMKVGEDGGDATTPPRSAFSTRTPSWGVSNALPEPGGVTIFNGRILKPNGPTAADEEDAVHTSIRKRFAFDENAMEGYLHQVRASAHCDASRPRVSRLSSLVSCLSSLVSCLS